MPEGDTIWRTARTLEAALSGRTVRAFESSLPTVSAAVARHGIIGQKIEAVEAHGKHLHICFDGGAALHTHLGMRGSWQLYRTGSVRPRGRSRARIETADAIAHCFAASPRS